MGVPRIEMLMRLSNSGASRGAGEVWRQRGRRECSVPSVQARPRNGSSAASSASVQRPLPLRPGTLPTASATNHPPHTHRLSLVSEILLVSLWKLPATIIRVFLILIAKMCWHLKIEYSWRKLKIYG